MKASPATSRTPGRRSLASASPRWILVGNLGIFELKPSRKTGRRLGALRRGRQPRAAFLARLTCPPCSKRTKGRIIFISASALQIPARSLRLFEAAQIAVARGTAEAVAGTGSPSTACCRVRPLAGWRISSRPWPAARASFEASRPRNAKAFRPADQALRHAGRGGVAGGLSGEPAGLGHHGRGPARRRRHSEERLQIPSGMSKPSQPGMPRAIVPTPPAACSRCAWPSGSRSWTRPPSAPIRHWPLVAALEYSVARFEGWRARRPTASTAARAAGWPFTP